MNGGTHHKLIVLCSRQKFVENCRVLPIVFIVIAVVTLQTSRRVDDISRHPNSVIREDLM
jgi:hypothetical protein